MVRLWQPKVPEVSSDVCVYTVGDPAIYDQYLGRDDFAKSAGGTVWPGQQPAAEYLQRHGLEYGIYLVDAVWATDVVGQEDGTHVLNKDVPIVRRVQ